MSNLNQAICLMKLYFTLIATSYFQNMIDIRRDRAKRKGTNIILKERNSRLRQLTLLGIERCFNNAIYITPLRRTVLNNI